MKVQPAAYLRTTLPLDLSQLGVTGQRALPFDLAAGSHGQLLAGLDLDARVHRPRHHLASPHRHLDAMVVAGAAAVLSKNVPIATSVIDTVRRHPAMIAQAALTIDHLSKGRFILGIGSRRDREHGALRLRLP